MKNPQQAFKEWIERMNAVTRALRSEHDSRLAHHPEWHSALDARLGVFSKAENVLNSVALAMDYERYCLFERRWWMERHPSTTDRDAQHLRGEFDTLLRMCLVHFLYCAVESSFRIYLRAMDPSACGGGTKEFESIYRWLFKRLKCHRWMDLMHFWRLIRNSVHNNGVYWHPRGREEDITFDGEDYSFRIGKAIECTWEIAVRIAELLPGMLHDVTTACELVALPEIIDPAYQQEDA